MHVCAKGKNIEGRDAPRSAHVTGLNYISRQPDESSTLLDIKERHLKDMLYGAFNDNYNMYIQERWCLGSHRQHEKGVSLYDLSEAKDSHLSITPKLTRANHSPT